MEKTLFAKFDPSKNYGMFGYAGNCCEVAIRRDDPEQAKECWNRGWMDSDTRMLIGTVIDDCDRRAPNVAKVLRSLGATQCEPEMVPAVVPA